MDKNDIFKPNKAATLYDMIEKSPGLTLKALAEKSGFPMETVRYHAQSLAARGFVEMRPGRVWTFYVAEQ